MTKLRALCLFFLGFLTSLCAENSWFASAGLGTSGLFAEVGYTFNSTFRLRVNGSGGYHFRRNLSIGDYTMENVRVQLFMKRFLMDWHFIKNGLRLTGGVGFNGTTIKFEKNLNGMKINDMTLGDVGIAHVKYRYRPWSPYVGIGYDWGKVGATGWEVVTDVGCFFMGIPRARVTVPQQLSAFSPAAYDYFTKLGREHKWLRYYPVVTIGLRYQF